jgi:hypothetical protein
MRLRLNRLASTPFAAAVATLFCARVVAAQQAVTLRGSVRDSVSGRPLGGAIVGLGFTGGDRATRTDDAGEFAFSRVPVGSYSMTVKRLGYEPFVRSIDVRPGMDSVSVALTRVFTLDTVRIRATNQGIYGAVGTAHDLRPLRSALVQVLGGSGKISVDSSGHFYIPIKTPGAYMIRAMSRGYVTQTMSVTVRRDEGVEIALLLDSAATPESNRWDGAYADLADRMTARRNSSAIVSASELRETGYTGLVDALRRSPSFNKAVLRIGGTACVFVDGQPKPGFSLDVFDATEVEAIEAYTASSDGTGTLARRWPRGVPCPSTGEGVVAGGNDVIRWIVVWLKR